MNKKELKGYGIVFVFTFFVFLIVFYFMFFSVGKETDFNFLGQKTQLYYTDPVRCHKSFWEAEWFSSYFNLAFKDYPKDYKSELVLIKKYFKERNVHVKNLTLIPLEDIYGNDFSSCASCSCMRGDRLFIEVTTDTNTSLLQELNFQKVKKYDNMKEIELLRVLNKTEINMTNTTVDEGGYGNLLH